MAYGTLSVSDLLATSRNTTVADIGEDRVYQAIDAALVAGRTLLRQKYDAFVEMTTERLAAYGGPAGMVMQDADEFGRADAQKVVAGANVGFPLFRTVIGVQWTSDYMQNASAQELAENFTATQTADVARYDLEIRKALFSPTNYTFTDRLLDNVSLSIKRLVNADSDPLPLGPNGETFNGATHTHYLGTSALVAADVSGLITHVTEHFGTGQVHLTINVAQEAAVRAMPNFTAYPDPRIVQANTAAYAGTNLTNVALINFNSRDVGVFDAADVQVRPWVPAGYMLAWIDLPGYKVLRVRERRQGAFGLRLMADYDNFPLRARALYNEYGAAAYNRVGAAALDTTHASYTLPTLT
jgi:hypothetical protein